MESRSNPARPGSRSTGSLIKAFILLAFILFAVYLVRFSPVKEHFTVAALSQLLEAAGAWAPIAFIFIYAVGVCLFIPGSLLTGLGAALFGPYWGFVWVWLGAMLGASASFLIGRTLGREFAASLAGDRLQKYDDAIERNGFTTVLYLRLIYFPFTPMNFGMGITKVRFWDYFAGTALGIVVGTFVIAFFFGTLKQIWASGDWGQILSTRVFVSVGLFIFSLFIPVIVKKFKGERAV
ncbi:TVP38/TMEM64 family protein [Desulfoferrobacter suflitae]|uniref:TVP38/TMEM64 family protein n=1 Tax=Desulfoferrobacter suflitae TaxID=2865782 RepID=UPI0021640BB0|nr:TVP38/TMEM64 family protein [Desulfoferrobacter suflitae]MCK8600655.1 TVP38/TMEM64 family protein [Desulfoferrobacter suflitae]